MAAARQTDINELFECPVCYDSYTDPRTLVCTHQFCLKCIEPLVSQEKIICPNCRNETLLKPGEEARNLPRPVLMNEVQTRLENIVESAKESAKKYCDLCEGKKRVATHYCYDCQKKLCGRCLTDHEEVAKFIGHEHVTITADLFCKTHDTVVSLLCHDCKCGICSWCDVKEHKEHKKEDIHAAACQSRDRVREFIVAQHSTSINEDLFDNIESMVQKMQHSQNNVVGQIDKNIGVLRTIEAQLKIIQDEVLANTSADIDALKSYRAELRELNSFRNSLMETGEMLLEKASDPELVMKALDVPEAATIRNTPLAPPVSRPAKHKLYQQECEITQLMDLCKVEYESDYVPAAPQNPMDRLEWNHIIKHSSHTSVRDMAFNSKLSEMAVRTNDKDAPVKIYNLCSTLVKHIGRGIQGLDGPGDLSIDPHRDLYLAPCGDQLTTIDMEGNVHDVIKVYLSKLVGVAYCATSDQYIVTDVNCHRVVIIDAMSRIAVRYFGSEGDGNEKFRFPSHVCVGDIRGKATIVVSDCYNHAVKLFDLSGGHLKTYGGNTGSALGPLFPWDDNYLDSQLRYPQGVALDPAGRVVVCDTDRNRVVTFGSDGDTSSSQCLFSGEDVGGIPVGVCIDPMNKLVAFHCHTLLSDDALNIYSFFCV